MVGGAFNNTRGERVGVKKPKLSSLGLGFGSNWKQLWREMGGGSVGGGSGVVCMRWWSWWVVHLTTQGGGAGWGQKTKTKPWWLGFSSAMSNGGRERWWEVAGQLV